MCVHFGGSLNKGVVSGLRHTFQLQMGEDVPRATGLGKWAFLQRGSFGLECVKTIISLLTGF